MGGVCNDSKIDLFMVILGNWNWRVGDENKVEINNLYNEFHLVIVSRRGGGEGGGDKKVGEIVIYAS